MHRRNILSALALLLALLLAGCGGAASAPGSAAPPPAPSDQQTTDVNALLAEIDRSERDLEAQLGPSAPLTESSAGAASGAAPDEPAKEPEPAKPSPTTPPAEGEAPAATPPPSPCDVACRALASMQRSAARICELTGDGDSRCSGARTRVSKAEARCDRAGCECKA